MVIIRLSRGGAKKRPFYVIHVCDSRARRDGRFIERLGYYNPMSAENEPRLSINEERLAYWKSQGAQLSDTVVRILKNGAKKAEPAAAAE